MAKFTTDATIDAMLAVVANSGLRVDVCSAEPTTYAQATSTYSLGSYTLTAGAGNGDWVIANGDTSGRKLTLTAQTGNNATANGTATHIAITNGVDTLITGVTCSSESTNTGSPLDISAVDIAEISDIS